MNRAMKQRIVWQAVKDKLHAAHASVDGTSAVDDAHLQAVLHDRAKCLAEADGSTRSLTNGSRVLVFQTGDETYGIELQFISQVFPRTKITPVPGAAESLSGVANLQNLVRSIVSLRRLLNLNGSDENNNRYILLLRHHERHLGLQVEDIDGVRNVNLDGLSKHDDESGVVPSGFIRGVTPDNVIILRPNKLF